MKLSCENCLQVRTPTRWTARRLRRGPSCCRNTWRMSRRSCRLCTPCRLWWCRWSSLPVSSSFLTTQFYTQPLRKKMHTPLFLYIAFLRNVSLWKEIVAHLGCDTFLKPVRILTKRKVSYCFSCIVVLVAHPSLPFWNLSYCMITAIIDFVVGKTWKELFMLSNFELQKWVTVSKVSAVAEVDSQQCRYPALGIILSLRSQTTTLRHYYWLFSQQSVLIQEKLCHSMCWLLLGTLAGSGGSHECFPFCRPLERGQSENSGPLVGVAGA